MAVLTWKCNLHTSTPHSGAPALCEISHYIQASTKPAPASSRQQSCHTHAGLRAHLRGWALRSAGRGGSRRTLAADLIQVLSILVRVLLVLHGKTIGTVHMQP